MTRGELVALVKKQIGQGFDSVYPGDSGIVEFINDAYMYAVDAIVQSNPSYFTKQQYSSLVANQKEYDLPSDFEKLLMANIKYQTNGNFIRAVPLANGIRQVEALADTTNSQGYSQADPRYYIFGGNSGVIGFLPTPDQNVTDGLRIWYQYTPAELDSDSDEPAIPVKYHRMLIDGAYSRYLAMEDKHGEAERRWLLFDSRVNKMVENLMDNQIDEPQSVIITTGQDLYSDPYLM